MRELGFYKVKYQGGTGVAQWIQVTGLPSMDFNISIEQGGWLLVGKEGILKDKDLDSIHEKIEIGK